MVCVVRCDTRTLFDVYAAMIRTCVLGDSVCACVYMCACTTFLSVSVCGFQNATDSASMSQRDNAVTCVSRNQRPLRIRPGSHDLDTARGIEFLLEPQCQSPIRRADCTSSGRCAEPIIRYRWFTPHTRKRSFLRRSAFTPETADMNAV